MFVCLSVWHCTEIPDCTGFARRLNESSRAGMPSGCVTHFLGPPGILEWGLRCTALVDTALCTSVRRLHLAMNSIGASELIEPLEAQAYAMAPN